MLAQRSVAGRASFYGCRRRVCAPRSDRDTGAHRRSAAADSCRQSTRALRVVRSAVRKPSLAPAVFAAETVVVATATAVVVPRDDRRLVLIKRPSRARPARVGESAAFWPCGRPGCWRSWPPPFWQSCYQPETA